MLGRQCIVGPLTAAVAAVALGLFGCGGSQPKLALVKGTVTFKGMPVPYGNVMFVPTSGPTANGEIGPDGSYTLTTFHKGDGAVPGEYKVVIVAIEKGTGPIEAWQSLPPSIIPDKYTSIATTDLRATVQAGDNTLDFTLAEGE